MYHISQEKRMSCLEAGLRSRTIGLKYCISMALIGAKVLRC